VAKLSRRLYLGVDVGGTKVLAAVVSESGIIVSRKKVPTPRKGTSGKVVQAILEAMDGALRKKEIDGKRLKAVGIAIAGVVDPDTGKVVFSPNTNLTGAEIGPVLEKEYGIPVFIGNDVNMGTLGEYWLGAARSAESVVGVFPGTGIGGGIIVNGQLLRGRREFGGEIGHMIMDLDGPKCGCGERGCLEALASRTAIERDIRLAIEEGKKTILTEWIEGDAAVIKSGVLKRALDEKDKLVTKVMRRASEIVGKACLSLRHVLDPDVIVLGGGLVEACADFMLPIIQKVVAKDTLKSPRPGSDIRLAALGDDSVVLGAVALALQGVGVELHEAEQAVPGYPVIDSTDFGRVTIDGETYENDVCIRGDGKIEKRKKKKAKEKYGSSHVIGPEEIERVCKGAPRSVVIGTGQNDTARLAPEATEWLKHRNIAFESLPSPKAVKAYNKLEERKALIFHVTC